MKKLPTRKTAKIKRPSKDQLKQKFGFKSLVSLMVLSALVLFGVSGYYWYNNIFTDPDRILSGMLNKSLQTSSLYRNVSQDSGGQTVNQDIYSSFSPEVLAQTLTRLQEINDLGRTTVETETIGTPNTDYVRYTSINIEGNRDIKRNFDNVLNVWGKRESDQTNGQSASFLNDALFVIVPFGNLSEPQRKLITDEINATNMYSYTSAKKSTENGRPVMTYAISLDPQSLVKVLSKYVEVTGIGSNEQLNPASYEGSSKIPIELKVDMLSRHVKSIDFSSSGRNEIYNAYNVDRKVEIPSKTIDVNELQTRLSAIESQQ